MTWDIRRATPDDLPAITTLDQQAFGLTYQRSDLEDFGRVFEPERFLLAYDPADGALAGAAGSFTFDVTLPGAGPHPTQGVTWVGVSPTHRRRGVLRALMTRQLTGFREEGLALSVLTASEGGIYGRFGYGLASWMRTVRIDRRRVAFRADAPDPGGVRLVGPGEARTLAPPIQRRWAAITPGAVGRSDGVWDNQIADHEHQRDGESQLFHLVHPDGYASYRYRDSGSDDLADRTVRVVDFFAATDSGHAALWRVLLSLDLVGVLTSNRCPGDDPLPYLLTDPTLVRTTEVDDGLWARVLDVPAVLSARRYPVEVDVRLDVHDPLLRAGGRFRLRGGPDGADCQHERGGEPEVRLGIAELGALLFGGNRASTLARAGLVDAEPSVLRRLDTALTAEREPAHGTAF